MLNILKYFLTKNRCYQRNVKRTPIGIQLHTIGTAQGTAKSVADYWNQDAVSACVTYIVDCDTPGKVLQCLPEDVRSWADAGYGNNNLITFEICESDYMKYTSGASYTITDETKFKADLLRGYQTAVLLCADICNRYGWDPTSKLPSGLYLISSHDEGRRAGLSSAHMDPTHIWPKIGKTMDTFRADVKAAMAGAAVEQPVTEALYRVRKTWTDVKSQLFAGTLEGAKKACLPGYSVYDEDGKVVYTTEKNGFQASDLQGLTEAERIAAVAPLYQECMAKTGMLASVGIAQFCLESGYGNTDLAIFANNLHGMKASLSGNTWDGSAWDGESVYTKKTAEQDAAGNVHYETADFRKYEKCEDSIADRAAYFTNAMDGSSKRYPGLAGERDYKKAIQIIKDGGYATDVNYVTKLVNLVERWNLYQYDEGIDMPEADSGDILPETEQEWLRVGTAWTNGKCVGQAGAFHDQKKAEKYADKYQDENKQTYFVFDENGKVIYTAAYEVALSHIVQIGSFEMEVNAKRMRNKAISAGFDAIIKYKDNQHKVQCGVFQEKKNAENLKTKLEKAGFAVVIQTEAVEMVQEHIILQQCRKFQERLEADLKKGVRWEYHNPSKYLKEQWQQALDNKKYACNCALLARWALKEAGLIPQNTGIFYGKKGGSISWGSGAKAAVQKTCNLISIQTKTVKQLIAEGRLQPGDIVTYVDLQHTNIYAGDGKWYDAGHAYCSGSGEGAKYNSWYGDGKYDNQKVGWIIRAK